MTRLILLTEAARRTGYHPRSLRAAIQRGKLKGRKIGRDWLVQWADVQAYEKTRPGPRGESHD